MEQDQKNKVSATNQSVNKKLVIVTIVACILGVCGMAFGAWALLNADSDNQQPSTGYDQSTNVDTETIRQLDTLTSIVLGVDVNGGEYGQSVWVNSTSYPIAEELISSGTLSDKSKVTTIVDELWNSQTGVRPIAEEEAASIADESSHTIDKLRKIEVLDGSAVEKEYKKVYGEDIQHQDSLVCGSPVYDKTTNLYHLPLDLGGCGGAPYYIRAHFYKYDYEKDGNKAYVYITSAVENRENQICKLNKESASDCQDIPKGYSFALNEVNYNQFPKHRLVFVKTDDGKYYFEKVERM